MAKYIFCVLCVVLTVHDMAISLCPGESYSQKRNVQFGLMTAANNRLRFVSVGCIPAIELAVDLINQNESLLSGYELSHNEYIDTECERRSAYNSFFDLIELNQLPPSIAILGAGCSTASEPVAELAPFWSVPVISYTSASPLLSNRVQYPNFYRTYINDASVAPAFVLLTRSFGWRRITIITENEPLFIGNIREQVDLLMADGVTVKQITFNTDQLNTDRLDSALDSNDHVFFINTFEAAARDLLCYFYRKGLSYPSHSFITHAWFQEEWYLKNTTGLCTAKQVESQLDRTITFIPFIVNPERSVPTYSGLSADEFDKMYRDRLALSSLVYQPEAYTAFDAVYSLAIALDAVQSAVCKGDNMGCNYAPNLTSIEDFEYHNSQLECMLKESLSATDFTGVSGLVRFDGNGTRILHTFEIKQYQLDSEECSNETLCHVTIGVVNIINSSFEFLFGNSNSTVWPDGVPPDGTPIIVINTIPLGMVITFDILVVGGIVFAMGCLVFNIVFRNKRVVKLSSPNLNYVIIIGACFMYCSIILRLLPGTDEFSLSCRCNVAYTFSLFGYTLAFSAILSKMWRVYYIFHNPTTKKRSIQDWHLLIIVAVLTGVVCVLLLLGESIPYLRQSHKVVDDGESDNTRNELDVAVVYQIYVCSASTGAFVAEGLAFAYVFLLQLVAIVFAFQTRKVKIKALNDAKQVTAMIYISTICLIIFALTTISIGNHLVTTSVLYSLAISTATTVFLCLVFVPKMISLYRDPEGTRVFSTNTHHTAGTSPQNHSESYPSSGGGTVRRSIGMLATASLGMEDPKALVQKLQNRVAELREELELYDPPPPPAAIRKKSSIIVLKEKIVDTFTAPSTNSTVSSGGTRSRASFSDQNSGTKPDSMESLDTM